MNVPNVEFYPWLSIDAADDRYHAGYVGQEVERSPDDKPRRPIGFRLEPPPPTPDWMLI